MIIGTITLTFVNGAVLSGGVSFSPESGQILLPDRLTQAIKALAESGAVHEAVLVAGSREYRVELADNLTFVAELASTPETAWIYRAFDELLRPTVAQRQQMGRSLHALAVASLVGAVGLAHSYGLGIWTFAQQLTAWSLLIAFVILFAQGNILMEPTK